MLNDRAGHSPNECKAPSQGESIQAALSDAGYDVQEVEPPEIRQVASVWSDLQMTELGTTLLPAMRQISSPDAVRFLDLRLEAFPPVDLDAYISAFTGRARMGRSWAAFQEQWSLVLGTIATVASMEVGSEVRDVQSVADIFDSMRFVVVANALGLPAVVTPIGLNCGLPHAVQLVGPRFGELDCLAAAGEIEKRAELPPFPIA